MEVIFDSQVDQQANQVRRLQRNNDELQEQVENLRTQVDHLQTRYELCRIKITSFCL